MKPDIQTLPGQQSEVTSHKAGSLFLIDSMSFIFRAYHARARSAAPPMRTTTGIPTEAVYIFHNMLRKLLATYNPEYVGAVFDLEGPTFRHESFADYKANRTEMPGDLAEQLPYIRRLLQALRIPVLAHPGFEADDVIGTLAHQAAGEGLDVFIISSDKDMLQLVGANVCVLNPMKDDLLCDTPKVIELMGVEPDRIPDVMALQGDSIDNIPGAPGIGEKGARDLIQKYGRVEACLEHASEVSHKRYREALTNYKEQILLSKQLATIDVNVPLKFSRDDVRQQEPDRDKLKTLYQELEFAIPLRELLASAESGPKDYQEFRAGQEEALRAFLASMDANRPAGMAVAREELSDTPLPLETANIRLAIAPAPGKAALVDASLLPVLQPWLEDRQIPKALFDLKSAELALRSHRIQLRGVRDDVLLYSYLLDANEGIPALANLVERQLGVTLSENLSEHADYVAQLAAILKPLIDKEQLIRLYQELELPLASILAEMEAAGVKLDPAPLAKLSAHLDQELQRICQEIYKLTGCEFNINSPKQLGEVLFTKMGLPAPRKYGKGKVISTAIDVLEELALSHEAPRRVLEYRQMAKLKSTYVDTLPKLIRPSTGRLHTTFNQAGAATGRLSSSNPNLQNIPIRTEMGREIRAAFIAEKGFQLLAADYSQIELRLLAHLTEDPLLLEAFQRGDDIHALTATTVFGVPAAEQTPEHRRRAKAINYGIVYGLSAFGLSQQLGIPQAEAQQFIDQYFQRYQGVKRFIDVTLEEVRRTSRVHTFFGRMRKIPEITSKNWSLRQFAERAAVNTPLQGGAADLIKLAMIGIHEALRTEKLSARMILQVHDELILEVPDAELAQTAELVRERMENAYSFRVPIIAEVMTGPNWRDMKELPR